jgi:hypothetical protein
MRLWPGKGCVDAFQFACLVVKVSQVVSHEVDPPDSVAHLLDADVLPREDAAEIDLLAVDR